MIFAKLYYFIIINVYLLTTKCKNSHVKLFTTNVITRWKKIKMHVIGIFESVIINCCNFAFLNSKRKYVLPI